VLAYNDVFQLIAAIGVGMLVWLAFITFSAAGRPPVSPMSKGAPATPASP
jgi:threonine/homoserine/homoserine lactone efflux protein